MAKHLVTGRTGEDLAVSFLMKNGYQILHRNWRYKHWEADVIVARHEVLHIVEVKTKRNIKYGYPEDAVTRRKIKYLLGVAEAYLEMFPKWQRIQLDIVAIVLEPQLQMLLIEDVYL
jgi:putative endonuclease